MPRRQSAAGTPSLAISKLRHTNIVQLLDWNYFDDGAPALVMEFLAGHTLADEIAKGPLSWKRIRQILSGIINGLQAAHDAGIIHRDLKPQNIFLALDRHGAEQVKLLDFGVSKLSDEYATATASGNRLMGTPAYMAPEQARCDGASIGPHTDVWALGAIMYEMATGAQAFAADNLPSILYRICHQPSPDPRALRDDASAAFCELVKRCMSRGPDAFTKVGSITPLLQSVRADYAPKTPPPAAASAPTHVRGFDPSLFHLSALIFAMAFALWWIGAKKVTESVGDFNGHKHHYDHEHHHNHPH